MNAPKRVTVKDIIRGHRQRAKAVAAGFADSEEGLAKYREAVFSEFRHRHEQQSIAFDGPSTGWYVPAGTYEVSAFAQFAYDSQRLQNLQQHASFSGLRNIPVNMRKVTGARGGILGNALGSVLGKIF